MFSENLKTLRKQKGFSQEELATRLHVVRQTISKWEKNLSVPDADTLIRLAEILEVSVSELLGTKIENENVASDVAEQLSRINEQLAIKNRRSRRIWKIVAIILAVIVLVNIFIAVFFSVPDLNSNTQNNQPAISDETISIDEYLISEVMELPEQAEDQVYYQLLKMAGKSMLEQIGEVERERLEYKEYIEQWIHEIKTPITAMKLLCENHRTDWTKELLLELEKTNRFTEQALYYARSEHTEKDYSVREMALSQVVHQAIADNKYLLLQGGMRLEVEEMQDTVYSDEKWVRFILNQLIANAVKYRTEQPVLRISTHKRQDQVVLVVEDNGIGIAASDLPRIFEKGFTGQNGRMVQQSTGIGLYLCKRLCEKLGIGITAESSEHGTAISLSFHINCLIHEVQS